MSDITDVAIELFSLGVEDIGRDALIQHGYYPQVTPMKRQMIKSYGDFHVCYQAKLDGNYQLFSVVRFKRTTRCDKKYQTY